MEHGYVRVSLDIQWENRQLAAMLGILLYHGNPVIGNAAGIKLESSTVNCVY